MISFRKSFWSMTLAYLAISDAGVLGDLLGGVAQRFFKQQGLILEHTDLGGGGAGIDDQSFDGHCVTSPFYILWLPPGGKLPPAGG